METGTLPTEVLVVLVGAGVVVLGWLLLRFGKLIARAALVTGGLTLALVVGLAMLDQAAATKEAATAAKVAAAGQATTSVGAMLCAGGLGAVALLACGAAVVFYVRWRLAERRRPTLAAPTPGLLNYRPRRQRQRPPAPEIVYLATGYEDDDLADFAGWGW